MNTVTLLELVQAIAETSGDYLTFATTTNLTTNNAVVSTTLNQYDSATDGYFDGWWVYLNTTNNPTVERRTGLQAGTTTYATATGTLTVAGAALAAETGATTCYLFKYKRSHYVDAIVEAVKQIYPDLHKRLDNQNLITGNILPDAHFEEWSSSSALTWYTGLSGTLAQTSTAALHRGGTYSAKYTAGAGSDYIYISSDSYPRLLDLQNQTVNFYVQAYPEVANDAYIQIYTVSNDGSTTQTLTSTTTCPAGVWTELELENQSINNDLEEIQIRFGVTTNTKYVYFDDSYLCGMHLTEYLLPSEFVTGKVNKLIVQTQGNLPQPFYDLNCFNKISSGEEEDFAIVSDGTNMWLNTRPLITGRRMRLLGIQPLETLSSDTDTITLESHKVPLIVAKAREVFWGREAQFHRLDDYSRFTAEYEKAHNDYLRLLGTNRMAMPR